MKPHEFTFETILERADEDALVKVTARVESYAASVGFPDDCCRLREVTILNTECPGLPLSDLEIEELHAQAIDQVCYH